MKGTLRRDLILLLSLALLAGALWLCLARRPAGAVAVITVDGAEWGRYPLDRDRTLVIPGWAGGGNTLVIREGTARVTEADCPDKLCVGFGAISREGESILCLPHRVVITVEGGEESEVDLR